MNKIILTLLICVFCLQGCTSFILKKTQGVQEISLTDVKTAYFDTSKKEFVLCIMTNDFSESNNVFTLHIPEKTYKVKNGNYFDVTFNKKEPPNGISMILDLYAKSGSFFNPPFVTVSSGCVDTSNSFETLPILRTTKELTIQEAMFLKGKTIETLLANKKPFIVIISDLSFSNISDKALCNVSLLSDSCIMLITKPESEDFFKNEKTMTLPRLILIHQQATKVEPQSLWSLLLPLTVPLDFATIIAYFSVIVFGSAFGG